MSENIIDVSRKIDYTKIPKKLFLLVLYIAKTVFWVKMCNVLNIISKI